MIINFSRKLAAKARMKGRSGWFGGLFPLFWVLGEILGGAVGFALDLEMGAYALAIGLAIVGGFTAFIVVKSIEPMDGFGDLDASEPVSGLVLEDAQDPSNPYSPPRKI